MSYDLTSFTDILGDVDEIADSQPLSLSSPQDSITESNNKLDQNSEPLVRIYEEQVKTVRPPKYAGQRGDFRSVEEIAEKYRHVFIYPYFNLVQSKVIDDALYTDKSMVVCAPTGSGKTIIFELAIIQLLMELEAKNYNDDFKIIYMAPVKALCTERLTEWHSKFTRLGLLCIEVTGDTDVDFSQLKPYRIIITTPEKWDMLTRRWRDHRSLVEVIKLFLIDEVHILNDETRGPVLEAVVSRMKTIELSAQSAHKIEKLQKQYQGESSSNKVTKCPHIRFVAVSATVNNPEDVAAWLGTSDKPAVFYKFGDESRPVKLNRIVEGYPCPESTSIFKFDIILNYKLWPVIQKYHNGKPTLIFCNTRKSVVLTAETLAKELTVSFTPEQKAKLTALASTIKTKKIQLLILNGVGCHHAGLLYEERTNIEQAFRNRDLPILITTTTLAMGVNLPAHLVIIKNTQRYNNGAYEEYSISTILQMIGRAGRPQFDTEATAVILTRLCDKSRYQALVGGSEPLQSYLHKRLPENLNSEAALGTVNDVAQCVQWLRSTFLFVRAARDPKWYLGLPPAAPMHLIFKKIEELCVKAMNMLASAGLITMDEASCIASTDAGKLMSIYYLDLETMKLIMKIEGTETLERLLMLICESHELSDMHLRMDERRCLNTLNRNNAAATIRFPMKGKIKSRQMKLNCIIQAVLGCLPIPDPPLNQEAMKVMRITERICKCLVVYVTRSDLICTQPAFYTALLNSIILSKCIKAHLWENSPYVSRQLKGIGLTFSTLLATAGKTTFSLLLESHPRDLERIMNKGPPAGNLLRKQISLLPRYQITMIPIDEKRVSVKLLLVNQSFLAENQDNLTAGNSHSCYVIIGDSENHVLLLTHFIDKDLIGIYNGTINYEITRKHSFEHNIFVNCISSKFVGIDAQCEYVFKSLDPVYSRGEASLATCNTNVANKRPATKQTSIKDVYQERKRKNMDEISQSKEKKRRDNALMEKFQHLKESFGNAAKEIKTDLNSVNTAKNSDMMQLPMSYKIVDKLYEDKLPEATEEFNEIIYMDELDDFPEMNADFNTDDVIVDQHIDNILNDIENEISNNRRKSTTSKISSNFNETLQNFDTNFNLHYVHKSKTFSQTRDENNATSYQNKKPTRKTFCPPKKRQNIKTNFSFIDSLAKDNVNEEKTTLNKNCFSDTIKDHIEKFLQKHKNKTMIPNKNLEQLIETKNIDNECEHHNIIDLSENRLTTNKENIIEHSPDVEKISDTIYSNVSEKDQKTRQTCFEILRSNENVMKLDKENTIQNYQLVKTNKNDAIILRDGEEHKLNYITRYTSKLNASNNSNIITNDTDLVKYQKVADCTTLERNTGEIQKQSNHLKLPRSALSKTHNNFVESVTEHNSIVKNFNLTSAALKIDVDNSTELRKLLGKDSGNSHEDSIYDSQNNLSEIARNISKKLSISNIGDFYDESNKFKIKSDENKCTEKTCIINNLVSDNELYEQIYDVESYPTVTETPFSNNEIYDIQDTNNKIELVCFNETHKKSNTEHIEKVPESDNHNYQFILARNVNNNALNIYGNLNKTENNIQNIELKVLKYKFPFYTETHLNTNSIDNSLSNSIGPLKYKSTLKYLKEETLENTGEESIIVENYDSDKKVCNRKQSGDSPCSINRYSKNINDNNAYIKKISYSASKINVHVKDARDHKIQIISKLKVDLDVTQIVSKKDMKNDHNLKNIYSDESYNLRFECPITYSLNEMTAFNNNLNNLKLQAQNTSISDSSDLLTDRTDLQKYTNGEEFINNDTHLCDLESYRKTRSVSNFFKQSESLTRPKTVSPIEIKDQVYYQPLDLPKNNKHSQPSNMPSIDNHSSAKKNTSENTRAHFNELLLVDEANIEAKENICKIENNENSIKNILQKYSLIFRKGMNHTPNAEMQMQEKNRSKEPDSHFCNKIKPMIESLEAKRKRPYKISELNNYPNKPISKITLEPHITIKNKEKTDKTYSSVLNNNINKDIIEITNDNKHYINYSQVKTHTQEYDDEIPLFPPQVTNSPIDYDLPVDEIDNAMFNPKTLLQCYQTESEEIIPPPFQFCDLDNTLSPLMSMQTEKNESVDYNGINCNEFEMAVNNTSIFEYDDREQLTPTKEIETWTLLRDDYVTNGVNNLKSCTVVRKVSPHYNISPTPSRYNKKISVFKFKQKDRMKLNE